MNVGLFIPCYVDQFYPQVGIASLELLQNLGCKVHYPMQQTCCGQPMANSGFEKDAIPAYEHFVKTFSSYDYIVAPSGSCTYHVRKHYDLLPQSQEVIHVRERSLDLAEFLVDVMKLDEIESSFPHKVGLHQSCHGLRGLRLASGSERVQSSFSKIRDVLDLVGEIEFVDLDRKDECCGFGGTFAVNEEAISVKMGKDRIRDHQHNGAEVIVAGDMSCLMHLEGIMHRNKVNIPIRHFVEILNGTQL
ncbi:MAG: (Fe-S)-binding protein [Bacteroidota bacterium]